MKSYEIERYTHIYALLCKVGFFFFLFILLSCRSAEEADVWCQWFLKSNSQLKDCFILKYKRE